MPEETAQQGTAEFTPITSQEQLDAIIGRRVMRERDKYADYESLKAKAAKLDEMEAASKSELERAKDEAKALREELDGLKASMTLQKDRKAISEEFGIPEDILRGSSAEELREHAEAIKKHKKLYPSTGDKGEKRTPKTAPSKQEFLKDLFERNE